MPFINTPIVTNAVDSLWDTAPVGLQLDHTLQLLVIAASPENNEARGNIEKMMQACKLGVGQYHCYFLKENETLAWQSINAALQPSLIMLMGISPTELGIKSMLATNTLADFYKIKWVVTAAPETFFKDTALRGHIWNQCLRVHFKIGG